MTLYRIFALLVIGLALVIGMVTYVVLVMSETSESVATPVVTNTAAVLPEGVTLTAEHVLPVRGSAPTKNVRHTIPLEDIRRGCLRQDCIPAISNPEFVPAESLIDVLSTSSLGIRLTDAERFYPFPMLERREIVNDTLPDGTPIAVTYCPLCGTGIVFNRELSDGVVREFGVSGMLWQSNLLMYDRATEQSNRNLWSQVLGQAVVGDRAGEQLRVLPSDVITFGDWVASNPDGATLNSGDVSAPYGDDYYGVASQFAPDFDPTNSPLNPQTRVHGIVVNGQAKAYVSSELFTDFSDIIAGQRVFVEVVPSGQVTFFASNAAEGKASTVIPDIEGFWFSWAAAHPDTELWIGDSVYE